MGLESVENRSGRPITTAMVIYRYDNDIAFNKSPILVARNKVAQSRPPRTKQAKTKKKSRITSTATVPKYVKEKLTTSTAATKMNITAKAKTKIHKAARTKKTKASLKIRDTAVDRKPTPTQ